jgi:hypothetical protein
VKNIKPIKWKIGWKYTIKEAEIVKETGNAGK